MERVGRRVGRSWKVADMNRLWHRTTTGTIQWSWKGLGGVGRGWKELEGYRYKQIMAQNFHWDQSIDLERVGRSWKESWKDLEDYRYEQIMAQNYYWDHPMDLEGELEVVGRLQM